VGVARLIRNSDQGTPDKLSKILVSFFGFVNSFLRKCQHRGWEAAPTKTQRKPTITLFPPLEKGEKLNVPPPGTIGLCVSLVLCFRNITLGEARGGRKMVYLYENGMSISGLFAPALI
jgi:hypothetical protein